jgi:hypothetical protein
MFREHSASLSYPQPLVLALFVACLAWGAGLADSRGATFIVTSANDSGSGSLRAAILNANATTAADTITFSIGTGAHTINLLSALPAITNAVIDGTTQPGYNGKPLIELNGSGVPFGSGLLLSGGTNTIRGLIINRFGYDGIDIVGGGTNTIAGNYIGTDSNGTGALGNGYEGIYVYNSCSNVLGGIYASNRNVISGNSDSGIYLNNSWNNLVQGNYIGPDATGGVGLGNKGEGITLSLAANNTLGGTVAGAGNLISANGQNGIGLYGPGLSNTVVQGNLIGTTAAGTTALGNGYAGVYLWAATNNYIGGQTASARNLISGNQQDGLSLNNSSGNTVAGNYIGLNTNGSAALANQYNGVTLNNSIANTVGGAAAGARNLISGNSFYGIQLLAGATANTIQGNFIGTDATGRSAVRNQLSGVRIEAASNTIGGTQSGAGNLISGNGQNGIFLYGPDAGTNLIQGNWLGTTVGGTNALGNGRSGLGLLGAPGNLIGGSSAGAANVISANSDAGLYLFDRTAAGNQIQGNKIGTDVSGLLPLGNAYEGIYASNVVSTLIGGTSTGAGNVISANHYTGIYFLRSSFNTNQGNWIGTGGDGVTALGNGWTGIDCDTGSLSNVIGGSRGAGNCIAFTAAPYSGVRVRTGALNNRITYNAIFSNGALGIDLGLTGVNLNDLNDTDSGANNLQNFPVLAGVVGGSPTWIRGTLNSTANSSFQVQFFANPAYDSSGYGQGQVYLGETNVNTGPDGNGSFLLSLPVTVPVGSVVTATATDPAGNTSEFSACAPVGPIPRLAAVPAANHQLSLSWTNTASGFALLQTTNLAVPIQWTAVTNVPAVNNGQFVVTLSPGSGNRFYRLSFQ